MKTRIIRAGLTMSSMLVTPAALAQAAPDASAPAPASANVSAQTAGASSAQSSNVNADIIVTAQRREERLRDVPLTITARSADDLAKAGVTSARELAVVVPGLTYTTQGAWAEPAIRGISTSLSHAGADTPIAIYVDGFYQANQIGNVFDLADIRQVEVLKGPQGTLFGRNATGGAILIHTLDPTDTFTGNLSISDGVFTGGSARTSNDLTLKGFVGGPIVKDVLSFSLSGYYGHTDGYLTNDVDGKRVGEIDSKLIRGKLKFTPTDTLRFTLSAMYTDRSDATGSNLYPYNGVSNATQLTLDPASGTYVPAFPGVFAPTKPWHVASEYAHGASISAKSYAIDLRSEWDIGQLGTLTSLTGYSHSKSDTLVNVDSAYSTPSCTASFTCVGIFVDYPSKTWQQELSFSSKKFSIFTLTAGLFYYHDKAGLAQDINPPVDADGHIDVKTNPGPLDTDAHITTKAWAGFGEIYADVTDRLRLVGGLRYSWEQKSGVFRAAFGAPYLPYPTIPGVTAPEKSWHSVTPRASVLYKATDELNLYFTFSKGFKSGVFDSTCNTCPYANPENLTSFEGGLKFGSRVASFNLSAFY
jgi:iron complex outermembrane receptor protein